MMGQRDLYTDESKKAFERALSLGATYSIACAAAGWSYRAYREWMVAAEADPNDKHADLPAIVARARAQRAQRWLASIEKAAQVDWKAAAWKLERCEREDYGRDAAIRFVGDALKVEATMVDHRQALREAAAEMSDAELGIAEEG